MKKLTLLASLALAGACLALDNVTPQGDGSFYEGSVKRASLTVTNLTVAGKVASAVQTHIATNTATTLAISAPMVEIDAKGQVDTYTNIVTVAANATDGQRVVLSVIAGATNSAMVVDSAPCSLAGNWLGGPGDTLSLIGRGTNWIETGRSNN